VAIVRSRRAVQTAGPVRRAGLLGTIAGTIALSGASCGGIEAPLGGPSNPVVVPEGGAGFTPIHETVPPNPGNGTDDDATAPSPGNGKMVDDAAAQPLPIPMPDEDAAEPSVQGAGPACVAVTAINTVGTLITVQTTWPATAAVVKGAGPVYVWLLSTYDVDGNERITGTTTTCGMQMPVVTLSAVGDQARGLPAGQTGQERLVFPATSWSGVPSVTVTGTVGGLNVGSSVAIEPVVLLYGLASTSAFANGSTQWPSSASVIGSGSLTYANGMPYQTGVGQPGILATYDGTPPYYVPSTSLSQSSPTADESFLVLRTQLRLYGTSVSCSEQTGQAFVNDLNFRVVGCQLTGLDGSDGTCASDQAGFLDANATQFQPGTGTFVSKNLPAGATCADVLGMFPSP
jgi:hypothetical protein